MLAQEGVVYDFRRPMKRTRHVLSKVKASDAEVLTTPTQMQFVAPFAALLRLRKHPFDLRPFDKFQATQVILHLVLELVLGGLRATRLQG
mmetsp:Transcript_61194/g.115192  ORF Transcript_61194/g.115192 Transcript_61194/m.115192 type:complete len:90 (+) Transcript_61194:1441-1710(+)